MESYAGLETQSDTELIKQCALFPILLDMLIRDAEELALYNNKLVYVHLIRYVEELQETLREQQQQLKQMMKQKNITIITRDLHIQGIRIEYRVRGYTHHFEMSRSRIKAELMVVLHHLRRRTL